MRTAFVLLALLGAMPAAAQTATAKAEVSDGECWATFTVLAQAAKTPGMKAAMDAGVTAAKGAIQNLLPKASPDELGLILSVYGSELMTAVKNKSLSQKQLLERANACEAQYGLPVSPFSITPAAPAKPE